MSNTESRLVRAATVLVALVAFAVSYHALGLRAAEAGLPQPLAWVFPLAVDGTLIVGMVGAHVLRRARPSTRAYIWGITGVGLAISELGNALAGPLRWDAVIMRGSAPLLLALSLHALIILNTPERHVRAERRPVGERPQRPQVTARPSAALLQLPEQNRSERARRLLAERPEIGLDELIAETKLSPGRARALRAERTRALAPG